MKHLLDYGQLRALKDSTASFTIMGVDMATRKVDYFPATLAYTDHTPVVRIETPAQSCVCPANHRFLTSTLAHPFIHIAASEMSWIRAKDLVVGMYIAVAPFAPLQAKDIYSGCYIPGHKILWAPVRNMVATNIFEHYGVKVNGTDNYIMNDMLHKSYGEF